MFACKPPETLEISLTLSAVWKKGVVAKKERTALSLDNN
jgi:hypothetical protein